MLCCTRALRAQCLDAYTHTHTHTPRRRWFLLLFKIAGSIQLIDGVWCCGGYSQFNKRTASSSSWSSLSATSIRCLYSQRLSVPVLINSERSSTIRRTKRRTQAMAFWCESANIANRSLPMRCHSLAPTSPPSLASQLNFNCCFFLLLLSMAAYF